MNGMHEYGPAVPIMSDKFECVHPVVALEHFLWERQCIVFPLRQSLTVSTARRWPRRYLEDFWGWQEELVDLVSDLTREVGERRTFVAVRRSCNTLLLHCLGLCARIHELDISGEVLARCVSHITNLAALHSWLSHDSHGLQPMTLV